MYKGQSLFEKLICLFLIVLFSLPIAALVPQKTSAQGLLVPVGEGGGNLLTNLQNTVSTLSGELKEYGLDKVAYTITKAMIRQMTADMVDWINNGFEGGPAFISDPQGFFTDLGDQVLGEFIDGSALGFLCDPFRFNIQLGFGLNFGSGRTYRYRGCTLSSVINNVEAFVDGDFSQGGWDGFLEMSTNPFNNPYGSYLESSKLLTARIEGQRELTLLELETGNGFLSQKECVEYENTYEAGGDKPKCLQYVTVTPGSVIENQLNNNLGSGVRQLELADEINEIVDALMGQLIAQIFANGGLAGSARSSSSKPQSLRNQLTEGVDESGLNEKDREVIADAKKNEADIQRRVDEQAIFEKLSSNGWSGSVQDGNIALGSRSSQSSVQDDGEGRIYGPDNAINGDRTNNPSITLPRAGSWWTIEFKEEAVIEEILIYQRIADPLQNVVATLYDKSGQAVYSYDSDFGPPTLPTEVQPIRIQVPNALASSLRIQKKSNARSNRLSLTEVEVYNNLAPVIQVLGQNPVFIPIGSRYSEASAKAEDKTDGDISSRIVIGGDTVNTTRAGTYTVTYNVVDNGGVRAQEATRTINVR